MHHAVAFVWLVCLLVGGTVARSSTYHVGKDGTWEYNIIQDAVDAAAPGDTILVHPGRYDEFHPFSLPGWTEDVVIGVEVSDLTIIGTSPDSVIVGPVEMAFDPGGVRKVPSPKGLAMQVGTSNLSVQGIKFEGTREGMYLVGSTIVEGCHFEDCANGIVTSNSPGPLVVRQCLFGAGTGIVNGISTYSSESEVLVQDSQFLDNDGIYFGRADVGVVDSCAFVGGKAGVTYTSVRGIVRDSTFLNQERYNVAVVGQANVELYRNVLGSTPDNALICRSGGFVSGRHNTFEACEESTLLFTYGGSASLDQCEILSSAGYAVHLEIGYTEGPIITIDLRNNYWGTADSTEIAGSVIDGADDPAILGLVEFAPFLVDPAVATQKSSIGRLKSRFEESPQP